ncbi:large conductance mechanosensitive channel protein MscL [Mycoplasmopsis alligatoris]|uniref:Putative large conductance mechanosensitive channel protein n=1 Tax=Mycoplasmopsis alligatoris A21JP2 TaxID=747682 RepID=D4XX11_9BACT|nr:MscL family protein [Mycoplasmopsis alligatoris]EFF41162.1 putative large conductance mechanosensitive channel protein [Mycoplasmopsis alligatoris A21JP2]
MITKSMKQAKDALKKGNIFMLAVAFLIGVVFNAVVTSLANDVIMSAIAKHLGFEELAKMQHNGILYGKFLAAVINFFVVAVFLFFMLTGYFLLVNFKNRKKVVVKEAPKPSTDELILEELKKLNEKLESRK